MSRDIAAQRCSKYTARACRWLATAVLGLATVVAPCAAADEVDAPVPLFDYWGESRFLVDVPGASNSLGAGFLNPAAWALREGPGLLLSWEDPEEAPLAPACGCGDAPETGSGAPTLSGTFRGALSLGGLGFGMRSQSYDAPGEDELTSEEYMLALGGSPHPGYGWGIAYRWGRSDEGLSPWRERVTLGTITRWRPFSLGLAWHWDVEAEEGLAQADVGLRPFGPWLTLFADATFDRETRWDDLGTRAWRTGYGLELHPLRGVVLGAKALNDGEASVRLGLSLARGHQPGAAASFDRDGDHAATTYAYETGLADPDLGLLRARPRYPEIDLRGELAYQRYRWFDDRRTLMGTLRQIDAIAADPRAGGVVLNLSGLRAGAEMVWELREQLAGLRAQGKKVIVYVDRAGLSGYLLASVADQIWMDPMGDLDLRGVALGRTYLRGALDKLGLGVDEWRLFTYKSAFETLSRESMSEADREQLGAYLDDVYEYAATTASQARGLSREAWERIVNEQGELLPREALAAGLVDSLGTYEQARRAAQKAPRRAAADATAAALVTLHGDPVWEPLAWGERGRIAVLYALGACEMDEGIKGRSLSRKIKAAADDPRVKAIVLRADSPGGDPLPSDLVAREMLEASKKKPVIVSQGQLAGSGGYWISMYGDTIVAAPMTVTGSIGVIGGWIWDQGLGEKLGIGYEGLKRGEHADLGRGMILPLLGAEIPERGLTPQERERVEQQFRTLYGDFVDMVAKGRGLPREQVDRIGQGRIWSGTRGREIGLVDEIGGLWRSLLIAKEAAGIDRGRDVAVSEGPELGLFRLPIPRLNLLGLRLGGGDSSAQEQAELAAAQRLRETAAELHITPAELEYLRQIAQARGAPLLMTVPFEVRDGVTAW